MSGDTIFRIAKWEETFEKSDAARCETAFWISLPNSFGSAGFQALLDEFGDESPAIYGCWVAIACVASKCTVRGVLADSKGQPLKLSWIARQTGFPVTLFERLLKWAASPSVQWLVSVPAERYTVMLAEFQTALRQRRQRAVKKEVNVSPSGVSYTSENITTATASKPSGQHPDGTANHPDGSAIHPDRNARHPDSIRTTRQDNTSQDKTIHHRSIDRSAGASHPDEIRPDVSNGSARRETGMEFVLRDRWTRLKDDKKFCEDVLRGAIKLGRLKQKHPDFQLSGREIWSVSWACNALEPGVLEACYERIRNGHANNATTYLAGAMRKMCNEHVQLSWISVQKLVPDASQVDSAKQESAMTETAGVA